MPRFLFQASYTVEGVKGLLSEGGTRRKATVQQAVEAMGGSLETFDYAFGSDDVFAIVNLPDVESAAALALTIVASGLVNIQTTVLISPEQVDEAAKKTVIYRPPGQ